MNWPTKNEREEYEINEFIKAYGKLNKQNLLILIKQEKPDFILNNVSTNVLLGVELTSVKQHTNCYKLVF